MPNWINRRSALTTIVTIVRFCKEELLRNFQPISQFFYFHESLVYHGFFQILDNLIQFILNIFLEDLIRFSD